MKLYNEVNPLLEFDVFTEDGEIVVFFSFLRFGKRWGTGLRRN